MSSFSRLASLEIAIITLSSHLEKAMLQKLSPYKVDEFKKFRANLQTEYELGYCSEVIKPCDSILSNQ